MYIYIYVCMYVCMYVYSVRAVHCYRCNKRCRLQLKKVRVTLAESLVRSRRRRRIHAESVGQRRGLPTPSVRILNAWVGLRPKSLAMTGLQKGEEFILPGKQAKNEGVDLKLSVTWVCLYAPAAQPLSNLCRCPGRQEGGRVRTKQEGGLQQEEIKTTVK